MEKRVQEIGDRKEQELKRKAFPPFCLLSSTSSILVFLVHRSTFRVQRFG
jgi:hypothetical protein